MALTDLNRMMKSQAIQGVGESEAIEQKREIQKENIKAAEKAGTMGAVGTGASIGATVGGPWGALIGAGIGFLADSVL